MTPKQSWVLKAAIIVVAAGHGIEKPRSMSIHYQFIPFLLILACFAFPSRAEQTLFVGPDGKDTNPGTLAAPFASIEKARNTVRGLKKNQPITVYFLPGEYQIQAPVIFTTMDSGTSEYPVTYKTWGEAGTARLTSARRINNWTPEGSGVYSAQLSHPVHAVFENGTPGIVAREPDAPEGKVRSGYYFLENGVSPSSVQYRAGRFANFDYSQASIQLWPLNWLHHHFPIENINFRSRVIRFTGVLNSPGIPNARFFIENVRSFLDQPGEFFVDRKTRTLYYKPRNRPIDQQLITVPLSKGILRIEGKSHRFPVHDLHFEGLALSGVDRHSPGTPGHETRGISIFNANGIELRKLLIENAGDDAIFLWSGASNIGISDCGIHGSRFGIRSWSETPEKSFVSQDTPVAYDIFALTITNNVLWNIGETAVHIGSAKSIDIGYNQISSCRRSGISLWTASECKIHHNHINHVALEFKDVAAGIYVNVLSRGIAIEDNRIHDICLLDHPEGAPSKAIYLDYDVNANIAVRRNVIYELAPGVKSVKLGGRGVTYQHNILDNRGNRGAYAKLQFWGGSNSIRWVPWLIGQETWDKNMRIQGNVFLADSPSDGDFMHFNDKRHWEDVMTIGILQNTLSASDRNLFYNPAIALKSYRLCQYRIEDWQRLGGKGYDRNSLFRKDPLFNDLEKRNYTFSRRSPALGLGIPQLDAAKVEGVGPSPGYPYYHLVPKKGNRVHLTAPW